MSRLCHARVAMLGPIIVLAAIGCGSATAPAASATARSAVPSASASATAGELERIRARGTLVVGIRVDAPPQANRQMGDPAHTQKRAFELAVATLLARSVFGPDIKIELLAVGADRLTTLEQGADIALTVETPTSRDRALISSPYAKSGVVLAAKKDGPVRRLEDVAGQALAVGQDELGARDIAQAYLQQRAIAATLTNYMGVNGAAIALDAGQAVAVIGDRIGVETLATARSLVIVTEIASRPYIVATRKSSPELAVALDAALRAALASGEIREAALKAGFPYQAP